MMQNRFFEKKLRDFVYTDNNKLRFPRVVFSSGSEPWDADILG
jgi:hypothetical protein